MSKVDVKLVKALRDETGVGISDCKNALQEVGGDIEKAKDLLRAKGIKTAGKKASRQTSEGQLAIAKHKSAVAIVGVNCETDFVGREANFQNFANQVAEVALEHKAASIEQLLALPMNGATVEEERVALISRVGENVQISQVVYKMVEQSHAAIYAHGSKLACAVFLDSDQEAVGRDVAMHVVAMQPVAVDHSGVPQDLIERERAVFASQAEKMGKPELVEKIVDGKMKKYFKEVCLLDQAFVKDSNLKISEYLSQSKARVIDFIRVELGE
ncbi:translation elongation factor Ts [Gammaproteobacteria bacterium]|nr:translation elongation factor Ts [Gammaproteobacteria bacterium]